MSAPELKRSERPKKSKEPSPFKPLKPKVGKATAKMLVECKAELPTSALLWVDRWMSQLVQERSLPPQIAGADAFGAISQLLAPQDALEVLTRLRKEFRQSFPLLFETPKEDFQFLVDAVMNERCGLLQDHLPPPASQSPSPYQSDDENPR